MSVGRWSLDRPARLSVHTHEYDNTIWHPEGVTRLQFGPVARTIAGLN
jgi:hypothetical protein